MHFPLKRLKFIPCNFMCSAILIVRFTALLRLIYENYKYLKSKFDKCTHTHTP